MNRYPLLGALLLQTFFIASTWAAPCERSCVELLRECAAYSGDARGECFYTSAKHAYCEGSELARLSLKRSLMAPSRGIGSEEAEAFLGSHLVDEACLNNFDNQLSAALIGNTCSSEVIEQLGGRLDACRTKPAFETLRP